MPRFNNIAKLFTLSLVLLLAACSGLPGKMEQPKVEIVGIKALPGSQQPIPEFLVTLRVINPNAKALNIRGIFYTVNIEGYDLVSGVSNNIPSIPGYGEENIDLTAKASLVSGIRLMGKLMQNPKNMLDYKITAKIDTGSIIGSIKVNHKGVFDLNDTSSASGK